MCGIAGFIALEKNISADTGVRAVSKMADALAHRGPDASGVWSDAASGVFFSHRRLSIIDLSENGAQPMHSASGRFVLTYNGEIYNFRDLAKKLEAQGVSFRGHSDTEVLLESFAHFGIERTIAQIKGMFAIALWDRAQKTLTLIRDHLGKKPLYCGFAEGKFLFASELKSFRAVLSGTPEIGRSALTSYMRFGFIPAPATIYRGIYKLKPGHLMTLRAGDHRAPPELMKPYWQIGDHIDAREKLDPEKLEKILERAVAERMISDVPLGAFLSGGIDSSLIAALMQKQSARPIQTYCIGFEEAKFDESPHAYAVAKHLGTDHLTHIVTAAETREIIPALPDMYDEPFADYSQIPTYHVCKAARRNAVVALSGDGGDEVFCGYSRYFMTQRLYNAARAIPGPVKSLIAAGLLAAPESLLDLLPMGGRRLHSIARFLDAGDIGEMTKRVMSISADPARLVAGSFEEAVIFPEDKNLSPLERMMLFDTELYLPDDILAKVDRASMAVSLEVRAPLLDKDVIEYAWRVRQEDKIFSGGRRGKKPLYDLLCRYVPAELVDRPKQGFSVPVAEWLRGPLKEWAEDMLSEDELHNSGLFEAGAVRKLWADFKARRADNHHALWAILMAQAWQRRWIRA